MEMKKEEKMNELSDFKQSVFVSDDEFLEVDELRSEAVEHKPRSTTSNKLPLKSTADTLKKNVEKGQEGADTAVDRIMQIVREINKCREDLEVLEKEAHTPKVDVDAFMPYLNDLRSLLSDDDSFRNYPDEIKLKIGETISHVSSICYNILSRDKDYDERELVQIVAWFNSIYPRYLVCYREVYTEMIELLVKKKVITLREGLLDGEEFSRDELRIHPDYLKALDKIIQINQRFISAIIKEKQSEYASVTQGIRTIRRKKYL